MTDANMASHPRDHRIEIVSSFLSEGYVAECSCGWISDEHADSETAVFYGREHARIPT